MLKEQIWYSERFSKPYEELQEGTSLEHEDLIQRKQGRLSYQTCFSITHYQKRCCFTNNPIKKIRSNNHIESHIVPCSLGTGMLWHVPLEQVSHKLIWVCWAGLGNPNTRLAPAPRTGNTTSFIWAGVE